MKYFVLTYTGIDGITCEFYLKGKSRTHLAERILNYSKGILSTSKGTLYTSDVKLGFLREINLEEYPQLTKQDFGIINEYQSYSLSDIQERIEEREAKIAKQFKNNIININKHMNNKSKYHSIH